MVATANLAPINISRVYMNFDFIVADFMPEYIQRIFRNFDGTDEERVKLDNIIDSWGNLEFNALSLLLNSHEMVGVYKYLAQYKLSDHMWRVLLVQGFVYPYSVIKKKGELLEKEWSRMMIHTLNNLSRSLHQTYAVLSSGEMEAMIHGADEGFFGELFEAVEKIELPIMNVLRLLTKQRWPENYYQYLIDPELGDDFSWLIKNVYDLKKKEAPWINDMDSDFRKVSIELNDEITASSLFTKYRVPYRRFISLSLENIGGICEEDNRKKVRFKKNKKTVPSEISYIYLEEKYWVTVCSLLFNLNPEHIKDTDNIQRDYRKFEGVKDLE